MTFKRAPRGATLVGKISNPAVFFGHFVKHNKPLWMRSALESISHPGLSVWTDDYLRKKFPYEPVKVETAKKEDRSKVSTWLTINQFLGFYTSEDIYMVHSLDGKMAELALVPQNLHCGGFQKMIQEAVLWLGSGETKSVLHYDELDNFLCMLDGKKRVVLIDRAHKTDVEAEGFVEPGGYSSVDMDDIDIQKYSKLYNTEWYEVVLSQGDCLFIPRGWYHQVTSSGHRHMAVNIWFARLHWFDASNCSLSQDYYKPLEPVSTFGFASPNEVYRSKLLDKLAGQDFVTENIFVSSVDTSTSARRSKFFDAVNKYKDGVLSWNELYDFHIDKAIIKFPDIFGLPGNIVDDKEEIVLYDPILPDPELNDASDEDDNIVEDSNNLPPDEPGLEPTDSQSPLPDVLVYDPTNTKEDADDISNIVLADDVKSDSIITKDSHEKKIEL
ncbi:hypothetical protein Btru_029012 [Bulinus truncatus]|nr:hypothetical protein Btru_029012 [Bulinus truncatus]